VTAKRKPKRDPVLVPVEVVDEIEALLRVGFVDKDDPCRGEEPACPECRAVAVLKALGRWP
jgi:hypothetical protein